MLRGLHSQSGNRPGESRSLGSAACSGLDPVVSATCPFGYRPEIPSGAFGAAARPRTHRSGRIARCVTRLSQSPDRDRRISGLGFRAAFGRCGRWRGFGPNGAGPPSGDPVPSALFREGAWDAPLSRIVLRGAMRRLNPSGEYHWYGSKDAFGRPCVNIARIRTRIYGCALRTRHLGAGNVGVIRPRTDISQELDPFIRNPSRWSRPEEWTMVDGAGLPAPVIRKSPPDIGLRPSVQMVLRLRLRHHPAKGRQRRRTNPRLRTKADALALRRKKPPFLNGSRRLCTPQG